MIEFQVVQHHRAWPIVDELRALVAKRGVVLIGFDDEKRRVGELSGKTCGNTEIHWHTADQKPRGQAGIVENPRQHRSRGRLAVRPRHRQHPTPAQDVVSQPLRPRHIGQATIKNFLQQRIATRNGVADHEDIRCERNLLDIESLNQLDPCCFELRAHRRIDIRVAPGHPMSCGSRQLGNPAHKRAADTENVNMHETIPR